MKEVLKFDVCPFNDLSDDPFCDPLFECRGSDTVFGSGGGVWLRWLSAVPFCDVNRSLERNLGATLRVFVEFPVKSENNMRNRVSHEEL